jgi:hypothetical protein
MFLKYLSILQGHYSLIINDCPIAVGVENPHKDRFPLLPVSPPIGDTSLTHVMRLAAHSTTSPTPTEISISISLVLHGLKWREIGIERCNLNALFWKKLILIIHVLKMISRTRKRVNVGKHLLHVMLLGRFVTKEKRKDDSFKIYSTLKRDYCKDFKIKTSI